jgi:glycosyltransferase involved in cell wall biosynthesis
MTMSTKNALICGLMPEFDRDSGSRRVFDLIDLLRESGWAVTFVSFHENCRHRYANVLQQRGVMVYAGAAKQLPPLIATGIFDLALFGLWHVAEPFLEEIRRTSPHTRIIVDSVDLHFLRNARRLFAERNGKGSTSLNAAYGSELVREINTYDAADAVLTVSQKEADLVTDFLGKRTTFAVPDCECLDASPVALEKRRGIVLVGCFRHTPNADAVAYLCQEILPLVAERVLAAHPVQIVGDGLTDDIRRLGTGLPFVQMVGWVPSVVPYLEHARLTVLPLRYGAGTKRKLLQTLAISTPAVSTAIGAEGFDLIDQTHVLIADEPATFAASIARLVQDDRLWRRLARNGRVHITKRQGRDVARRLLLKVVDTVVAARPKASSLALQSAPDARSEYERLVAAVRDTVNRCIPAGATVAIVSKGDNTLLELDGRTASHVPQAPNGEYAGWYPSDGEDAIRLIREVAARGAQFLVFPATAVWWLTHYSGLRSHLENVGREIVNDADTCVIFRLAEDAGDAAVTGELPSRHLVSRATQGDHRGDTAIADERSRTSKSEAADASVRLIAFLLPQFHPIAENDAWWGRGFTEWTNVIRARPLFPGHDQPRMPADLGFYDLRLAETRAMQAELARAHGIHGFCYYHYWFEGRMLLERPFNDVLASGRPDFPFCVCWANEPWSRRWDGQPKDVLQAQSYSLEDDRRHIEWLLPALGDSRAITLDGKPLLLVYQAKELPDPRRTTEIWRSAVERAGLKGIYLVGVETGWDAGWDATAVGFDAKLLFQPQFSLLRNVPRSKVSVAGGLEAYDYDEAWPILAKAPTVGYRRYSTVFPSWDNSPRRGTAGVVIHNATPASYEAWLGQTIAQTLSDPPEHRIVFINAWNEWAEGCYLEPDVKHGRGFLEATLRALRVERPVEIGQAQPGRTAPVQAITGAERVTSRRRTRGDMKMVTSRGRRTVFRDIPRARPAASDRGPRK